MAFTAQQEHECLRILTSEEAEAFEPLTREQIDAALLGGAEDVADGAYPPPMVDPSLRFT